VKFCWRSTCCQSCVAVLQATRVFHQDANKVSKSEGTRKVEYTYHFWKCADAVYPKLSKLVRASRNYSLPNLARFFLRHNVCVWRSCDRWATFEFVVVKPFVIYTSNVYDIIVNTKTEKNDKFCITVGAVIRHFGAGIMLII